MCECSYSAFMEIHKPALQHFLTLAIWLAPPKAAEYLLIIVDIPPNPTRWGKACTTRKQRILVQLRRRHETAPVEGRQPGHSGGNCTGLHATFRLFVPSRVCFKNDQTGSKRRRGDLHSRTAMICKTATVLGVGRDTGYSLRLTPTTDLATVCCNICSVPSEISKLRFKCHQTGGRPGRRCAIHRHPDDQSNPLLI
jgi:hypothetical protein